MEKILVGTKLRDDFVFIGGRGGGGRLISDSGQKLPKVIVP